MAPLGLGGGAGKSRTEMMPIVIMEPQVTRENFASIDQLRIPQTLYPNTRKATRFDTVCIPIYRKSAFFMPQYCDSSVILEGRVHSAKIVDACTHIGKVEAPHKVYPSRGKGNAKPRDVPSTKEPMRQAFSFKNLTKISLDLEVNFRSQYPPNCSYTDDIALHEIPKNINLEQNNTDIKTSWMTSSVRR